MANKKKTRHPGVYILEDGRYWIRATTQCTRTRKMLEATKTLPEGARQWEALRALEALKEELRDGGRQHPSRWTVTECAEQWLADKARRRSKRTVDGYESILTHHVLPRLGDFYLDGLTRHDIKRWVAWAEKVKQPKRKPGEKPEPYTNTTVNNWWRVLCRFFRDVCADHGLPDPTYRLQGPERHGGRRLPTWTLTEDQLQTLLGHFETHEPDWFAQVFITAYTGMRAGEVVALTWDDVDLEAGVVCVRTSKVKGRRDVPVREIPLTRRGVEVLREHRQRLIRIQHPGLASGYAFPNSRGGKRHRSAVHKKLIRVARDHEGLLGVGPQQLRRGFNTMMLRAGIDRVVLRSMMGHCSEAMTERYADVSAEHKRQAMASQMGPTWDFHLGVDSDKEGSSPS